MSKKVLFLWGFIIVGILLSVLLMGLSEKDLKYIKLEYTLKLAGRAHIKNNDINTDINESYVIFSDDLKNINKEELDKYCIDRIIYYNGLFIDKYTILKDCKKNKE